MNMDQRTLARWAFIIGLALAVIIGLVTDIDDWALWIMIVLALFAGYVFVSTKSSRTSFLLQSPWSFSGRCLESYPASGSR